MRAPLSSPTKWGRGHRRPPGRRTLCKERRRKASAMPKLAQRAKGGGGRAASKHVSSFSRRVRARVMPYHSQNRPAEQDRVTPKPAVGPAFGSIMPCEQVARIERQRNPGTNVRLGCRSRVSRSLSSGRPLRAGPVGSTRATNKREAERRQAHLFHWSRIKRMRLRAEAQRARLSAFHHGARCSDRTPQLSSRTRFLGPGAKRALSVSACPSPATESQTGHHAGRAFSQSRPGAEVTSPRPREPHSLRQPVSPAAVL